MDDWQENVLSSRHFHNRVGRSQRGSAPGVNRQQSGSFDVRKSLGTYDCKCAAANKIGHERPEKDSFSRPDPKLELYRLANSGDGIVGELTFPGVLNASLVLAGSRNILQRIITKLEKRAGFKDATSGPGSQNEAGAGESGGEDVCSNSDPDSPLEGERGDGNKAFSGENTAEEIQRMRYSIFEKNSFRTPKFWFQWRGRVALGESLPAKGIDSTETGFGYIVFSGNDCRKFRGTISCASLGWKDVSMTGWKTTSRSERNMPIVWGAYEETV